jgi:hypothetical protein
MLRSAAARSIPTASSALGSPSDGDRVGTLTKESIAMRRFEHRAHIISVSLTRHENKIEVVTEIYLPAEIDARTAQGLLAGDTSSVTITASEDIEQEACEAAKRMVNVLIAERAALSRDRR